MIGLRKLRQAIVDSLDGAVSYTAVVMTLGAAGRRDVSRSAVEDVRDVIVENETLRRRALIAEADADNLAQHLRALCNRQYEIRYTPDGPCTGCYQATYDHDEAVAGRLS